MSYLISGQQVYLMNHMYYELGSKAFWVNQAKLLEHNKKLLGKLNLVYYNAYLLSLCYLAYRHLFCLDKVMNKTDNPRYWYNSAQALGFVKLFNICMNNGVNPVDYLSYKFSSFRHQYDTYHHVYDFHIARVVQHEVIFKDTRYLSKLTGIRRGSYYFAGCPVLDFIHHYFNLLFVSALCENSFRTDLRDIRWKWISYIENNRKALRGSKLEFYNQFHHYPDQYENSLRFNNDYYSFYKLLGIPEDFNAFYFISDDLNYWTNNFTKNIYGYIDKRNKSLDINKFELYSVNVVRKELLNFEYFSNSQTSCPVFKSRD